MGGYDDVTDASSIANVEKAATFRSEVNKRELKGESCYGEESTATQRKGRGISFS